MYTLYQILHIESLFQLVEYGVLVGTQGFLLVGSWWMVDRTADQEEQKSCMSVKRNM